ncbi:lytic transglycosylase, partial [Escherichia coli]
MACSRHSIDTINSKCMHKIIAIILI